MKKIITIIGAILVGIIAIIATHKYYSNLSDRMSRGYKVKDGESLNELVKANDYEVLIAETVMQCNNPVYYEGKPCIKIEVEEERKIKEGDSYRWVTSMEHTEYGNICYCNDLLIPIERTDIYTNILSDKIIFDTRRNLNGRYRTNYTAIKNNVNGTLIIIDGHYQFYVDKTIDKAINNATNPIIIYIIISFVVLVAVVAAVVWIED